MQTIPQKEHHLLQVRIPEESWRKLRIAAAMRTLSTTALVSKVLNDFIAENDVPEPVSESNDLAAAW
jgi:predicted HicB family RNase H-like nuclease